MLKLKGNRKKRRKKLLVNDNNIGKVDIKRNSCVFIQFINEKNKYFLCLLIVYVEQNTYIELYWPLEKK